MPDIDWPAFDRAVTADYRQHRRALVYSRCLLCGRLVLLVQFTDAETGRPLCPRCVIGECVENCT